MKPAQQFGHAMQIKSLSLFISLEIDSLYGLEHRKIYICMTKCWAGFATGVVTVSPVIQTYISCISSNFEPPACKRQKQNYSYAQACMHSNTGVLF